MSAPRKGPSLRKSALGAETCPYIFSIAANSDVAAGGSTVTITGANFAGAPVVTFGTTPATSVVVVDARTITCTVPAHVAGLVSVTVTNEHSQAATLVDAFTYTEVVILSLSPRHGPVAGGTVVVVTGANFVGTPVVTFGGVAAVGVVRIDSQHVVCSTPAHAVGPVDVAVDSATMRGAFFFTLLTAGDDLRRNPSLAIEMGINQPSMCRFTVDGQSAPPVEGEEFTFHDDNGLLLFGGVVQTVEMVYEGLPNQLAWHVTCLDYTPWLNRRRPVGNYVNVSATGIILDLIAKFAPWVSVARVQSNMLPITINFDGSNDFATCLTQIAQQLGGGYWKLDFHKVLHYKHVTINSSGNGSASAPTTALGGGDRNPTAPVLVQGTTVGAAYAPGYYSLCVAYKYSNGVVSTPGPFSQPVLLDGVHLPDILSIPTGASISGIAVTERYLFYKFFGNVAGVALAGYAEITDNVTTTLTSAPQVVTFQPARQPVAAPPAAPSGAPSVSEDTAVSALTEISSIFPTLYGSGAKVSFDYQAGVWAFKVAALYDDGTESLPSPPSSPVTLDGFHAVRFGVGNAGSAAVVAWKVYGSLAPSGVTVPSFSQKTTSLWQVIPGNANATYDVVPCCTQDALNPNITDRGTPLSAGPVAPWTEGADPDAADNPADITDNNPPLASPQVTYTRDVSQLRNRVIVYGVTPPPDPIAHTPPPTSSTLLTSAVNQYANSVGTIMPSFLSVPVDYMKAHPTLRPWGGYPLNARWKHITSDAPDKITSKGSNQTELENYLDNLGLSKSYIFAHPFTAFMDLPENYFEAGGGAGVSPVVVTPTLTPVVAPVRPRYQLDELDSQRYMGSIELDGNGNPTDGVHEVVINTNYETAEECLALAQAQLDQFAWPLVSVNYGTRDPSHVPGQYVRFDLSEPPISGNFLILSVHVDQVKDDAEDTNVLMPRRTVHAADPSKFNLDDLLLLIGSGGDATDVFNRFAQLSQKNAQDSFAAADAGQMYADAAVASGGQILAAKFGFGPLPATFGGTVYTAGQRNSLNTVPISVVLGVPGKVIVPIWWNFSDIRGASGFNSTRNLNLFHTGFATSMVVTLQMEAGASVSPSKRFTVGGSIAVATFDDATDPVGLDLQIKQSGDTTGGSDAVWEFVVLYYLADRSLT